MGETSPSESRPPTDDSGKSREGLVVTTATLQELATDLVIREATGVLPSDGLLEAIATFNEEQLFGCVAYPQDKDGRGALLGMMLARIERRTVAVLDKWSFSGMDTGLALFHGFVERAPVWLSALECVVKETNRDLLQICKVLKMSAIKTIPNRFGKRDGIVMRRYMLQKFCT